MEQLTNMLLLSQSNGALVICICLCLTFLLALGWRIYETLKILNNKYHVIGWDKDDVYIKFEDGDEL